MLAAPPSAPVARFLAGKCELTSAPGGAYAVAPAIDKGVVQLVRDENQVLHFQWKSRITGEVDPAHDHMIFPGDAQLAAVTNGPAEATARLVHLSFPANASRRFMYWLQYLEADDDAAALTKTRAKDAENIAKFNDVMTNPDAHPSPAPAGAAAGAGAGAGQRESMQAMLAQMGFGGAGGAPPPGAGASPAGGAGAAGAASAAAAAATPSGQIRMEDLQSVFSSMGLPAASPPPTGSSSGTAPGGGLTADQLRAALGGAAAGPRTPGLASTVTAEAVVGAGVLGDASVVERLLPLLAEGQHTEAELREQLASPQFRQCLNSLQGALQSPENMQSVYANFGLDPAAPGVSEAMATGDSVGAFFAALQALAGAAAAATTPGGDAAMEDSSPAE